MLLALVFAFFPLFSPAPVAEVPLRRFTLPTEGIPRLPSFSPDGRYVAYLTEEMTSSGRLWVHDLGRSEPRVIFGPDNFRGLAPAWSPDSQFIVFRVGTELKSISVAGGPAVTVCDVGLGRLFNIAAWTPDGESIIFHRESQLYRVPSRGGTPELWLEPHLKGRSAAQPAFLGDGGGSDKLLYIEATDIAGGEIIFAFDRSLGHREKLALGHAPTYASSGHVLYVTTDPPGIWALPFSTETMRASGNAFPVSQNASWLSVGRDGTLAYLQDPAGAEQLVWRDRQGNKLGTIGQPQKRISYPALSPDGRRVAVAGRGDGRDDIWIHEVDRPQKTRLTTHEGADTAPTWSQTGTEIVFSSGRTNKRDLYRKRADRIGEVELLFSNPELAQFATGWSRDGKILLCWRASEALGTEPGDVFYLKEKGDGSGYEEVAFLETPFDERTPQLSPDGRYLAYVSDESGRLEVYIQSFPQGGGKQLVSVAGGVASRWRADGEELFYVEGTTLMAVAVSTSPSLTVSRSESLFSSPRLRYYLNYDVTPDGEKFVLVEPAEVDGEDAAPVIRIVQNWYEEFREREQD